MKKIKNILLIIIVTIFISVAFSACNPKRTECRKLDEYLISVDIDTDKEMLSCSQMVTYFNDTGNNLSNIKFNLYPNAYRKNARFSPVIDSHAQMAYYAGESYGRIDFESVKINGEEAKYVIAGEDENILEIFIDLAENASISVDMEYKVFLPKTHTRFGITQSGINLCNFFPILCIYENGWYENLYYPIGDPFYSETANFDVVFSAPLSGALAATGICYDTDIINGKKQYCFSAENVRDFAAVYLSEGKCINTTLNDTTVYYFYSNDQSPQKSLSAACNSLSFYSEAFVSYPYKTYSVIDTDFIYGGMEYPNLVLINNKLNGFSREYTIAHETAHQWWYGIVGNNPVEAAWQDEGLTEFSTALYFLNSGREKVYQKIIQTSYETYINASAKFKSTGLDFDGVMNKPLYSFANENAYVVTAYDKGMLMHYTLYNLLGENEYYKTVKQYYESYKYKNATPTDFKNIFSAVSPIIDSWLTGRTLIGSAA